MYPYHLLCFIQSNLPLVVIALTIYCNKASKTVLSGVIPNLSRISAPVNCILGFITSAGINEMSNLLA